MSHRTAMQAWSLCAYSINTYSLLISAAQTMILQCVSGVWCIVVPRKCVLQWVKSSRPINLLQPGLGQGLVSVHITEASIPGAARPTGALLNNWCCPDWMETLLCLYFYTKAITVLYWHLCSQEEWNYKMYLLHLQRKFVCTIWIHTILVAVYLF